MTLILILEEAVGWSWRIKPLVVRKVLGSASDAWQNYFSEWRIVEVEGKGPTHLKSFIIRPDVLHSPLREVIFVSTPTHSAFGSISHGRSHRPTATCKMRAQWSIKMCVNIFHEHPHSMGFSIKKNAGIEFLPCDQRHTPSPTPGQAKIETCARKMYEARVHNPQPAANLL